MSESDPRPARAVRAEDGPGARPYPPAEVSKRPQGPRSPSQSEPGDMGAFGGKTAEAPRPESPAGDSGGNAVTGSTAAPSGR